jgi:putative ABC transport system ATP-binding protein
LVDEPTASLDDAAASAALALLQTSAARSNATLVIATHDFRVSEVLKTAKKLEFGLNSAQIDNNSSIAGVFNA